MLETRKGSNQAMLAKCSRMLQNPLAYIDISRVNENQRLSGRDYIQRERRASHKLLFKKSVFQHHDQLGNFTQKIGQRLPLKTKYWKKYCTTILDKKQDIKNL